jgi:Tol biopolymer transport system component
MSITEDGKLAYLLSPPADNLQLVSIPDSAGSTTAAEPLTDRFLGTNVRPTWSPDGSRIAYLSIRSGSGLDAESDSFADRENYLVIKSLEDGKEKDIELPMSSVLQWKARPAWSEDGRRILFNAGDFQRTDTGITGRLAGFSVDLASGEVRLERYLWDYAGFWISSEGDLFVSERQHKRLRELGIRIIGQRHQSVFTSTGTEPLRPGEKLLWLRSPGIGWLSFRDCDPDDPPSFVSGLASRCLPGGRFLEFVDRQPGPETQGWRPDPWELSPDGNQVAYVRRNPEAPVYNVWMRSVTMDDAPTLVATHRLQEGERVWPLRWTPDGRHLIYGFGAASTDGFTEALRSVYKLDIETGQPELLHWNLTGSQLGAATFDPDARRAVIPVENAETVAAGQEIWMLQGFPWEDE